MDKEELIDSYIEEGYILLGYSHFDDSPVNTMIINEDQIHELIMHGFTNEVLTDEEMTLLVKAEHKYHLTPLDILDVLESLNEDDARERINDILYYQEFFESTFNSDDFNKKRNKDFFLEDNDHLVYFAINSYSNNAGLLLKSSKDVVEFIDDILSQKGKSIEDRKYKDNTLTILLCDNYHYLPDDIKYDPSINSFYKKGIEYLASKEVPEAMIGLGYDYYSGLDGYHIDFYKSEHWLKKAFDITQDPNLSRTLGYIYYYGRINNGVTEGDKAFKYFSHSHFTGGYFEATYKLADCYLHGYGTIKSPLAAFNIVDSIFDENRRLYLENDNSKYADVALRKGSYYLNGIGCEVDYERALFYLLEARDAIKLRLKADYTPLDVSVAFKISKYIEEAKEKLNLNNRTIIQKGYLLLNYDNYWSGLDIKAKKTKNNYYHIVINIRGPQHNVIGGDTSIFFRERTNKIEYLFKFEENPGKDFLTKKITSLEIEGNEIVVTYDNEDDVKFFYAEEVIYIPQHIKDLTKHVLLVSVEFEPNGKLYEYYSANEVMPEDIVKVKTNNNEIKEVKVVNTKYVYEDELPLPIELMRKLIF